MDFMHVAIREACKGVKRGQAPFGACIIKSGKVVARAHNTVWRDTDPTAHAEVNAIREACRKLGTIDLSGCTIYSTTEPCPMCFSAIHWARIGRIVYGASIKDAKKAGFNEIAISNKQLARLRNASIRISSGVKKMECARLLSEWFGNPY